MARLLLIDTGVLGQITHPNPNSGLRAWFERLAGSGVRFLIPEICDYELRRELIREKLIRSVKRLDDLKDIWGYVPIRTPMMRRAAELWAKARSEGYPTAHDKALDGDVILAAQAQALANDGNDVEVVTEDVGDLDRFVRARRWVEIHS
jgi:predicted nucleic acid-binding protein